MCCLLVIFSGYRTTRSKHYGFGHAIVEDSVRGVVKLPEQKVSETPLEASDEATKDDVKSQKEKECSN